MNKWLNVIYKLESKKMLSVKDQVNILNIQQRLKHHNISNKEKAYLFTLGKKFFNTEEYLLLLKNLEKDLDQKNVNLIEKPGSHDFFHKNSKHPCIPIGIYIDKTKEQSYGVLVHLTSTNKKYELLCNGFELNEYIPLERFNKYVQSTNINLNNTEFYDKNTKSIKLIRSKSSWMNGEFGDKKLIPLCELDNGKVQYMSQVMLMIKLENMSNYIDFNNSENPSELLKMQVYDVFNYCKLNEIDVVNLDTNEFLKLPTKELKFFSVYDRQQIELNTNWNDYLFKNKPTNLFNSSNNDQNIE